MNKETKIVEIPSQEVLEKFLAGMSGKVTVIFDCQDGKFKETNVKDELAKESEIQEGENG